MRVLCVDDDPLWLGLLREMVYDVTGANASVHTALTGADAVHMLEHSDFDIAIIDLTLCDIPGLELVSQVHTRWPSLPLVTLSDGREFGEVARARSMGAVRCLLKPLSSASFADVCRALGLDGSAQTKAAADVQAAAAV
jgi:two-component system response regulator YesN